jgi:hypothetical protein
MPDKMTGLGALFAKESTPDPTTEIRRPKPGRGLGALDDATTSVEPRPKPAPPITQPAAAPAPAPVAARLPVARQPKLRTSLTIPHQLHERLNVAFERDRWTMAALVTELIDRLGDGRITDADIDRTVDGGGAAIKSVKLGVDDLALITLAIHRRRSVARPRGTSLIRDSPHASLPPSAVSRTQPILADRTPAGSISPGQRCPRMLIGD